MHGNGCHGVHDCLVGKAVIDFGHVASEEEVGGRRGVGVIVNPEEERGEGEKRREEEGRRVREGKKREKGETRGGGGDRYWLGRAGRLHTNSPLLKSE